MAEYERYAKDNLPRNAHDYYASGSNDMITLRENRDAFSRLRLIPRILVDVSNIDMSTTVLGEKVSSPLCIAPTAMQQMAHPDGEKATSRAAAKAGTLMTLSSWSTVNLEDVAAAAPAGYRWFQLYVYKDRAITQDLVKRAEKAGYKALAVTVDTPILGRREADIRNKFSLPAHLTMGNFAKAGGAHASGTKSAGSSGSGLASYVASLIDRTLTWDDIAWLVSQSVSGLGFPQELHTLFAVPPLIPSPSSSSSSTLFRLRTITTMKIVVKGVLGVDDALAAVKSGVDGIWVSNHGARQLDTTPATIEVLSDVCRAVAGRCEVYLDGGITRGTDIFKAVALGARAVFIGRPVLWGLAHSGEEGVTNVVKLLKDEFNLAMALSGCVTIADIKPSMVRTAHQLSSKI